MSLLYLRSAVGTLAAPGATAADDREALLAAVASAAAVDVSAVRAGRVCTHCGATDHGRPCAEADGSAVGVSLSRGRSRSTWTAWSPSSTVSTTR